jgi:putative heme-binding domain-containing protein
MLVFLVFFASPAWGAEAEWVWSDAHSQFEVPTGATCYFRKTFSLKSPEQGQISINADDSYEVFVNGRRIAAAETSKRLQDYDIGRFLVRGNNIVAVKVSNKVGKTAALVARLTVKEKNGEWESLSTDATWKSELKPLPFWNTVLYNDRAWNKSQSFGKLGETAPWDRREKAPAPSPAATATTPKPTAKPMDEPQPPQVANRDEEVKNSPPPVIDTPKASASAEEPAPTVATAPANYDRFTINEEFRVEKLMEGDEIGSLIAMTFNEFGHILASQEGGPLLLIFDSNGDKVPDKVKVFCDKVKTCQGILALNGDVYVTAEGPDGHGLYRLSDSDRDGKLESVRALIKFECNNPEHGAHGIVLGPDGLIYVMVGNHAKVQGKIDPASPYRNYYDGELLQPKYEDPGGHAVGIKAPGGFVVRTDVEGDGVQLVAGGFRNAYDLAFNRDGDLFTYDSDMEADEGTGWYRPTRLLHVLSGGEYGWRSGWGNWPTYFVDSLPPVLETGRGSPTGMVVYNHFAFPAKYQGAVFSADWSLGRINVLKTEKEGASYRASSEIFLEGHPLNVTDLEVGPDGNLYFTTGGGTAGGLYRVTWSGQVPAALSNLGPPLSAVVRQPQLQASWSRQNIASLRAKIGDGWEPTLVGVARSSANPVAYRRQALDVLQLYGPPPPADHLLALSKDGNESLRARAADMLGLHADDAGRDRLITLLNDSDAAVRRRAAEALMRGEHTVTLESIVPLLKSDDRFEATAGRRLLERQPVATWREQILKTKDHRVLIQGGLALMTVAPSRDNSLELLQSISQALARFVSDRDFVSYLRVTQVALIRGEILPHDVPGLRDQLTDEFPASDSEINRELTRLLCFLQASNGLQNYLDYLKSDAPEIDRLHMALHLRFLKEGWTTQSRLTLLEFYEEAQKRKGGGAYPRYILNVTRDVAINLDPATARNVLLRGEQLPNAALASCYHLPPHLDEETLQAIREMDRKLSTHDDEASQRLQVGIVAILARAGDAKSLSHLRTSWEKDPFRRAAVAMGLAFHPEGENWSYLVRSLPILDSNSASLVLDRLLTVQQAPDEGDHYRQVILLGLRLKENGGEKAAKLLAFWSGESSAEGDWEAQLAGWQKWYKENFPDLPEAKLPEAEGSYKFEELLKHLTVQEGARGSAEKGLAIFTKAQCVKCHRFGDKGESMGPDLSTVAKRFTKREVLESIMFPSHVISPQFASRKIVTADGRAMIGIVAPGGEGKRTILLPTGEKLTLNETDIDQNLPSKTSAMPTGLLDQLTLEEIADLFAFLHTPPGASLSRKPK